MFVLFDILIVVCKHIPMKNPVAYFILKMLWAFQAYEDCGIYHICVYLQSLFHILVLVFTVHYPDTSTQPYSSYGNAYHTCLSLYFVSILLTTSYIADPPYYRDMALPISFSPLSSTFTLYAIYLLVPYFIIFFQFFIHQKGLFLPFPVSLYEPLKDLWKWRHSVCPPSLSVNVGKEVSM